MTLQSRFSQTTSSIMAIAKRNSHESVLQPIHVGQALLEAGGDVRDLLLKLVDQTGFEKAITEITTSSREKTQQLPSFQLYYIYSPGLLRIVELAWHVAARVNSQLIEPEHILVGILQEKRSDMFDLILKHWNNSNSADGINSEDVNERMLLDVYINLAKLQESKGNVILAEAYFTLAYELDSSSPNIPSKFMTSIRHKKENRGQEKTNRHDQYSLIDEDEVLEEIDLTFDAVAGIDDPDSEYFKMRRFFELIFLYPTQYKELAEEYGILSTNSILLFGPTGVGKTYVSKAIAGEFRKRTGQRITFINAKLSSIMDKWVGNTEKNISKLIQIAFDREPSLLLLDEIDSLGTVRHSGSQRDYRIDWVNHLLMELDRVKSSQKRILVIGCTNAISFVDPALRRRLGNPIVIPLPNLKLREEVFRVHIKQLSDSVLDEIDYSALARASEGFTPADIEVVVRATISRVWLQIVDQITAGNEPRAYTNRIGTDDFMVTLRTASPTVSVEQWVQETVDALKESYDIELAERVKISFQGYYQPETIASGRISPAQYTKRKWHVSKEPPPFRQ